MLGLPVNPTLGRLKQEDRECKDFQQDLLKRGRRARDKGKKRVKKRSILDFKVDVGRTSNGKA